MGDLSNHEHRESWLKGGLLNWAGVEMGYYAEPFIIGDLDR